MKKLPMFSLLSLCFLPSLCLAQQTSPEATLNCTDLSTDGAWQFQISDTGPVIHSLIQPNLMTNTFTVNATTIEMKYDFHFSPEHCTFTRKAIQKVSKSEGKEETRKYTQLPPALFKVTSRDASGFTFQLCRTDDCSKMESQSYRMIKETPAKI